MKKLEKPQLVIFDMDGTMLDTEPVSLAAMQHAGRKLGVNVTREIGESMMGKSIVWCRKILRENFGESFDIEQALTLHKEYVQTYYKENGVPTKPGLYELLDKLEALNIKKAVATSTGKTAATWKLQTTNIAHRFHTIIGGDEVENGKPAPDIFLKAAAALNTPPEHCIVLEDTEAGITGATAAKIRTIAIPDIAPLNKETRAKAFAICTDLF
jgi:HAD superfamily hydrolase (TIGR01509 family)